MTVLCPVYAVVTVGREQGRGSLGCGGYAAPGGTVVGSDPSPTPPLLVALIG